MTIPEIEKSPRSREYEAYSPELHLAVVKAYLFDGMTHRQIDTEVLHLDNAYSHGYQSMGILHYIGLTGAFKGLFSGMDVLAAINELKQHGPAYTDLIGILSADDTYTLAPPKRYTNQKLLHNCYDLICEKILDRQIGTQYTTFSFRAGIAYNEEGYKYEVWSKAHAIIEAVPWETPNLIGSGIIKHAALDALRVTDPWGESQNLVDWNDIILFDDIKKTKALEKALYELYRTDHDELSFNSLMTVIGNKFALISFLFFIKDKDRYAVVRPDNFAWRFKKLGVKEACTFPCSWKNYSTFLVVLSEVKDFLDERLADVTLLDAHSFVWMLHMIEKENVADMPETPEVPDNESYVPTCGTEGKVILYYTKKFERDPKLRAQAVRIHGCTCAVCGFSFEEKYGPLGKNYIEVHHCKPLFSTEGEVEVNPATDMVCLCSNCHSMIHRKKNQIMTVEMLKSLLR